MANAVLSSRKVSESLPTSQMAGSEKAAISAVSWGAVLAGAFVASAFSLALVALGAGIGLVSISPWSYNNPSVTTFGALAAAWFIAVQLFSSGIGGYLAGRLRTRWVDAHRDQVFFRDTAHGLLVWAVGAIVSALLLSSALSSLAGGASRAGAAAVQAAGTAIGGAASQVAGRAASNASGATAYFTDMLFRSDHPAAADNGQSNSEAGAILTRALSSGDLPPADKAYLAQMVASRTGLSRADAEKRVTDVFDQARNAAAQAETKVEQAADVARKTGVYVSLWAFVSLLVGALSASWMATVGGRSRDESALAG